MKETQGKTEIRISVRSLVEFILRSGDIDNRIGRGAQAEAMLAGSRMHRKIQRSMGAEYEAEVPLKISVERESYVLSVEGRADGIIHKTQEEGQPEAVTIDEIKGMYLDLDLLEEPVPVHLAQAKCYAYIYGLQHDLAEISVQMTYCNLDTEEIRRFREHYTFEELARWFSDLMDAYQRWVDFQSEWKTIRNDSIRSLEFPFAYREGQKQLVSDVYRTISREKILFIQAPTGVGKTLSTVFPAVKAVGEGLAEQIFYLTAKTVTKTVAKDTVSLLESCGCRQKRLEITAKEKICPLEEMECNPDACPRAKGHFDRVNDAVYELITSADDFTRERILDQAKKHCVCPFEMSLDVSLWCDVIICDYNYVFDPNVYLRRFFAEGSDRKYLFLIDEAHNLVDRARSMYSAELYKEDFLAVKKLLRSDKRIVKSLNSCNSIMLEWKRSCEKYEVLESIGTFQFALMRLASLLDELLRQRRDLPDRDQISEFYLNLRHFLNMSELLDEHYVIYTDYSDDGRFRIHLACVDPSVNLQNCLNWARSSILFSATLLPIRYYTKLLCAVPDYYAVYAKTVFSGDQRLLMVSSDTSSLYKTRNEEQFCRIAAYIYRIVRAKKGNYLAFFPSYRFLDDVYEAFEGLYGEDEMVEAICQNTHMSEAAREEFLAEFAAERTQSLVGFCVMGGIFSEGIDLQGEQLIGAVIVGTGLPMICTEREILREYFDQDNGKGFDYAYQYPGMNKVQQAAGRVIRTESDRGVIALLDSRFLRRDYQELFPREWSDFRIVDQGRLEDALDQFWTADIKEEPAGADAGAKEVSSDAVAAAGGEPEGAKSS